jgi:hypothetical protein
MDGTSDAGWELVSARAGPTSSGRIQVLRRSERRVHRWRLIIGHGMASATVLRSGVWGCGTQIARTTHLLMPR